MPWKLILNWVASVALGNRSEVRKVLLITLLLNLFVMALKAAVGFWRGSLSLQASV